MTVVFRVVKTKNYTMMSNQHLKDKRLTLYSKKKEQSTTKSETGALFRSE